MSERNRMRVLPALCLGLVLGLAAPATALEMKKLDRLFAERPASLIVFGQVDGFTVTGSADLQVTDGGEGYQKVYTLVVEGYGTGGSSWIGQELQLPPLVEGLSLLKVRRHDLNTGVESEIFSRNLEVEGPVEIEPQRRVLTEDETFKVRAHFFANMGGFVGHELIGNKIRVDLVISEDSPFVSKEEFNVESETIGPFPPGEYTLEIFGYYEGRDVVLQREKIIVTPRQAKLLAGRYLVEILLHAPHQGKARLAAAAGEGSALFYFFSETNWEAMVKVLDGCDINGNTWVFSAASTDVGFTLEVTDTLLQRVKSYVHPAGTPAAAITDTAAFVCDADSAGEAK